MIKTKNVLFLFIGLLVCSGVLLGIFIGFYWQRSINVSIPDPSDNISFCPPAYLVQKNQFNPDIFITKKLSWKIESHSWEAPDKIGFMQAIINKESNLICYYQWPNPKEKGSNLWMTVQLSPMVIQKINSYGSWWKITGNVALCSAGINACAVTVD